MSPSQPRKEAVTGTESKDCLEFRLAYRPPYAWRELMLFFSQRILPGVDEVHRPDEWQSDQWEYRRTLSLANDDAQATGWFRVRHRPARCELLVDISASLKAHAIQILQLVRRMFDINAEPSAIQEALSSDGDGFLEKLVPGLRLPGAVEGFECAVRAVLGQQVTVKAATTLAARLLAVCDARFGLSAEQVGLQSPWPGLHRVFPRPEQFARLSVDDIASQGIVSARAKALLALAQRWNASGDEGIGEHFCLGGDAQEAMNALTSVKGIGQWTAQYVCLRAMNWPDSFLAKDVVVLKALGLYPELSVARASKVADALALSWAPWRSYAVLQLWHGALLKRPLKGITV